MALVANVMVNCMCVAAALQLHIIIKDVFDHLQCSIKMDKLDTVHI